MIKLQIYIQQLGPGRDEGYNKHKMYLQPFQQVLFTTIPTGT